MRPKYYTVLEQQEQLCADFYIEFLSKFFLRCSSDTLHLGQANAVKRCENLYIALSRVDAEHRINSSVCT